MGTRTRLGAAALAADRYASDPTFAATFDAELAKFADKIRAQIAEQKELLERVEGRARSDAPKPPRTPVPRRPAKRNRRSSAQLEKTQTRLLDSIRANPGQRIEQIAKGMGTVTGALKRPAKKLVVDGKLRTKGNRRATAYSAR